jgi:hypothetical protein
MRGLEALVIPCHVSLQFHIVHMGWKPMPQGTDQATALTTPSKEPNAWAGVRMM